MIQDDEEHMVDHASVSKVRSCAQQPVAVSLNECFQLYTQEEKVSTQVTVTSIVILFGLVCLPLEVIALQT